MSVIKFFLLSRSFSGVLSTWLCLSVALLLGPQLHAQEGQAQQFKNIDARFYGGFHAIANASTGEAQAFYHYTRKEKTLTVALLDRNLTVKGKVSIPKMAGELVAAVTNGNSILFASFEKSSNYHEGICMLATVSLEGELIGKNVVFLGQAPLFQGSTTDNSYYQIDNRAITKYDEQLIETWKINCNRIESVQDGEDRLLIVQSKNNSQLELVCYDADNGDVLYITMLNREKTNFLPSKILVRENGEVAIAGEYYDSKKVRGNNDGIFAMILEPSGDERLVNYYSWADGIKRQMKKEEFVWGGATNRVVIHDIIFSNDEGLQIIGELYSVKVKLGILNELVTKNLPNTPYGKFKYAWLAEAYAQGRYIGKPFDHDPNNPGEVVIQDLIVFDFDEGLELTNVHKIYKPYETIYRYPGFGSDLTQALKAKGLFAYNFTSANVENEKTKVVFNVINNAELGIADIEKGSDGLVENLQIQQWIEASYASGSLERGTFNYGVGTLKSTESEVVIHFLSPSNEDKNIISLNVFKKEI